MARLENNGFPGFEAKKEAQEKHLAFSNPVHTLQTISLFSTISSSNFLLYRLELGNREPRVQRLVLPLPNQVYEEMSDLFLQNMDTYHPLSSIYVPSLKFQDHRKCLLPSLSPDKAVYKPLGLRFQSRSDPTQSLSLPDSEYT